jgi:hypothetical protein
MSESTKLYSHVGVATFRGKTKLRWSMGKVDARVKILEKAGYTNIKFCELPSVMTVNEAMLTTVVKDLVSAHGMLMSEPVKTKPAKPVKASKPANPNTVTESVEPEPHSA